jgi:hypothetical protein
MITENVIVSKELKVERKHFFIEFRENERGRFMRIIEETHGRRNTIIIPSSGIKDFMSAAGQVLQMVEYEESPLNATNAILLTGQGTGENQPAKS